jgi:hypothetical protein
MSLTELNPTVNYGQADSASLHTGPSLNNKSNITNGIVSVRASVYLLDASYARVSSCAFRFILILICGLISLANLSIRNNASPTSVHLERDLRKRETTDVCWIKDSVKTKTLRKTNSPAISFQHESEFNSPR